MNALKAAAVVIAGVTFFAVGIAYPAGAAPSISSRIIQPENIAANCPGQFERWTFTLPEGTVYAEGPIAYFNEVGAELTSFRWNVATIQTDGFGVRLYNIDANVQGFATTIAVTTACVGQEASPTITAPPSADPSGSASPAVPAVPSTGGAS